MSIQPLTRADSTNTALGSSLAQTTGGQTLGKQDFLKLLTTQLTNQDPLSPQDSTAFIAQLAQFSTVEGINNLQTSQSHLQASQMLGKYADATITSNNTASVFSGQITSVRWVGNTVYATLQASDKAKTQQEVTLDQVGVIRDTP